MIYEINVCHCSPMDTEAASQKNPLVVNWEMPGKQSATKAWFSKVEQATFLMQIL